MRKLFSLFAALTLSAGLWATSIWSGSQDVHWDNTITIDASKFASALPGNKIMVTLSVNDGTNDAIEFKANGQKLPGTRFSLCQDWWETYDLFMTQDMIDSCKVYGMEICGDNFTVTNIDLSEGKAASMKEGKAIWTGYFWVDSWSTLEVFREALDAVKDWSKYSAMRFYSECPTTDNSIFLLADRSEAGVIAKSEPAMDTIAGNPLKRYEGYAELDLTKVNPLTVINNVASDRLMIQMDKQGSNGFNFTDVVLVEQTAPAPVVGDKFEDATSGLKFEITAVGETNTVKVIENGIIIPYSGTSYTIPATVNYNNVDFAVTEIGAEAFYYCSSLESVTIPASVTTIGQDAFDGCASLQSVTLSEGLLTIGTYAFEDCSALASINIPASVTTIGEGAFNGCESLQSVTLSEGLLTIGESAFQGCESLQSVTLPEGLLTIGNEAFSDCSDLQSITIPASVTTIGQYAFTACESLQSVILSEGLLTIGTGAFLECSGLASVTFLGNACQDAIGEMAFMSVGDPDPALLTLPNSWTGTLPDEDGNWYGGKFEMSSTPTALPTLIGDGVKGNKFMHNGQLFIRKAGKHFNAVGAEL